MELSCITGKWIDSLDNTFINMKKQYYCEMESPIYRQIIAEKLKIEGKEIKGNKKGKRKNNKT